VEKSIRHQLNQTIKVNITSNCQHHVTAGMMPWGHFTSAVFLPKRCRTQWNHEKNHHTNPNRGTFIKITHKTKVMKEKERPKNCHRLETETWQLNIWGILDWIWEHKKDIGGKIGLVNTIAININILALINGWWVQIINMGKEELSEGYMFLQFLSESNLMSNKG
jgi:hypothetical protein